MTDDDLHFGTTSHLRPIAFEGGRAGGREDVSPRNGKESTAMSSGCEFKRRWIGSYRAAAASQSDAEFKSAEEERTTINNDDNDQLVHQAMIHPLQNPCPNPYSIPTHQQRQSPEQPNPFRLQRQKRHRFKSNPPPLPPPLPDQVALPNRRCRPVEMMHLLQ